MALTTLALPTFKMPFHASLKGPCQMMETRVRDRSGCGRYESSKGRLKVFLLVSLD